MMGGSGHHRRRLNSVLSSLSTCSHTAASAPGADADPAAHRAAAEELATAYHVLHRTKQYDLLWGLISMAVGPNEFLVVRFGVPFNKVRPGDILTVNSAGDVLHPGTSGAPIVHPAWSLLAQVHATAGERAAIVVHSHDDDVSLFAATRQPVLPLNQGARVSPSPCEVHPVHIRNSTKRSI